MEYNDLIYNDSPGNWSPFFVSTDTRETRNAVGQGICEHRLEHRSAKKRPVTIRYRSASLNKITLHDMNYSMYDGEARIHVPDMTNIYLCELNLAGKSQVGQTTAEVPFFANEIYMINANHPHTKRWESDGHQIMLKIDERDISAAVQRNLGAPIREPVIFENKPFQMINKIKTLSQMVNLVCSDIETEQSFFGSRSGDSAEELLIDLIIESIPNNYSKQLSDPAIIIRPRHIRFAAEYIHTNARERINLEMLVKASGVSPRSLHAGFKKYYDVSPMTYLKNVRLDLARMDLKNKNNTNTTVTEIAMNCGFNHLSKFSVKYKERFGELPSETLHNY